jgi:hypothetical protein
VLVNIFGNIDDEAPAEHVSIADHVASTANSDTLETITQKLLNAHPNPPPKLAEDALLISNLSTFRLPISWKTILATVLL